jgi:AcrR family transcriptional regulator
MTRLTRGETQARTKELLLEAAAAAFARQGYAGASLEDIAEAAGFSKGAVYSNFAGKEAIFLELLRRHMAREIAELEALLAAAPSLAELMAALGRWLDASDEDDIWSWLALELALQAGRSASFAAEYDALNRQHRAALGRLVAILFERADKTPPAPPEEIAGALMGMAKGMVLQRGSADRPAAPGHFVKLILGALVAVAEPAAPARRKSRGSARRR